MGGDRPNQRQDYERRAGDAGYWGNDHPAWQGDGLDALAEANALMRTELATVKAEARRATTRWREEESLKPYQAELIRLQKHLEVTVTG